MKIGLLDVDSKIPNLALMKISLKSRSKQRNGFLGGCYMANSAAVDFSSSTFWMLRSSSNERKGHNTIQTKDNEK